MGIDGGLCGSPSPCGWDWKPDVSRLSSAGVRQARLVENLRRELESGHGVRGRDSRPCAPIRVAVPTAQYALGHTPIIYDWDLRDFFKSLSSNGLREMNDPTNYGRRIATGANGLTEAITAKHAVDEAARLATLARGATEADDHASAIGHLVQLFNVQS